MLGDFDHRFTKGDSCEQLIISPETIDGINKTNSATMINFNYKSNVAEVLIGDDTDGYKLVSKIVVDHFSTMDIYNKFLKMIAFL